MSNVPLDPEHSKRPQDDDVVVVLTRSEARAVYEAVDLECDALVHHDREVADAEVEVNLLWSAMLKLCPLVYGEGTVPLGHAWVEEEEAEAEAEPWSPEAP